MKKSLSLFVGALVMLGATNGYAVTNSGARAASSADLSGAPATRTRQKVNYEKYKTRTTTKTYEAKDAADLYYTKPSNRSALYKQYDSARSSSAAATKTTKRVMRSETVVEKMKRKYFLAHPFYQPLQGKFGSHTDFSYGMNSYDVDILFPSTGLSLTGNWDMSQFAIKEDFSYGITDRIAIMGMLKYDWSEYKFEWDDGAPDDKMDDDGFNLFGLGAQWRFIDNPKWIAMASAYFQHQKDTANNFILDMKAGYKVASSTIYGLARGWYVDLENNSYGNSIIGKDENGIESMIYMPYQVGDTSAFYVEGGLGVFSVLDEDWTLNLEGVFGHYDWHNQASIKGALGWQPNDWFAVNLYAKTSFYDSADDKKLGFYWLSPADGYDTLTKVGTADISKYGETSVGVQVMFEF
ncbi:MAG: hypothetical protein IJD52_02765 [Alphaproteobacteria bacterium]|nr:hypothetical protein [Alphaproteobacteria bacterium]